jgi:hypothetical protein
VRPKDPRPWVVGQNPSPVVRGREGQWCDDFSAVVLRFSCGSKG